MIAIRRDRFCRFFPFGVARLSRWCRRRAVAALTQSPRRARAEAASPGSVLVIVARRPPVRRPLSAASITQPPTVSFLMLAAAAETAGALEQADGALRPACRSFFGFGFDRPGLGLRMPRAMLMNARTGSGGGGSGSATRCGPTGDDVEMACALGGAGLCSGCRIPAHGRRGGVPDRAPGPRRLRAHGPPCPGAGDRRSRLHSPG